MPREGGASSKPRRRFLIVTVTDCWILRFPEDDSQDF
jgi:hypothetical protein